MSIVVKSLKNYKKIWKELKKILKEQLNEKPNSVIGIEWKDELLKITNNLKKINNLDWFNTHIFPLYFYLQQQKVPLDKELVDNFIKEISLPSSHYEDITKLATKLAKENRANDLFLFENLGGVDLLIFFIDSRGNFAFNDYESKKSYLNKANNGSDLISIGIKSILNAKKIICFCIEEASKDIVFKLNKKVVDSDDLITYLQLHNDITLYTLRNIINKNEINNDSMTQDKVQFIRDLDICSDEPDLSCLVDNNEVDEHQSNVDEINLASFNQNMNNLDHQLFKSLNVNEQEKNDVEPKSEYNELVSEKLELENDYSDIEKESYEDKLIEQNISDIKDTAEEIIEQAHEIESNVEDVKSTINHIENELEKEKEYKADFIYVSPTEFEFNYIESKPKNVVETKKTIKEVREEIKEEKYQEPEVISQEEYVSKSNNFMKELFNNISINESDNLLTEEPIEKQKTVIDVQDINENLVIDLDIDQKEENILLPSKEDNMISIKKSDDEIIIPSVQETKPIEKPKIENLINEEKLFKSKTTTSINIPSSVDELYKYITIKNETLKHIEKLLLNNKLGIKEEELLEKINNRDTLKKRVANREAVMFVDENKHISNPSSVERYRLSYVPGFRPVPLLMVWYDVNKNFYNDILASMKKEFDLEFDNNIFDESSKHIWNDGCYIIYDEKTLMMRAIVFESIDRLIFLLRHINKKLTMRISTEQNYKKLVEILKDFKNEIKVEIV